MSEQNENINTIMTPLKLAIFEEVRKQNAEAAELNDEQLHQRIFHHRDGLRLTYSGFLILKRIFTVYSFEIPETIKARHHAGMANMEYPYFFTSRRLILFSEMDAMTVKLCGGIEQFLENCFLIDRY